MSVPVLRPYQTAALDRACTEWGSGVTRTAIVHPTGLGKGHIIARAVTAEAGRGGRAVVITHREEILDDLTARCGLWSPRVRVGRVQGPRDEPDAPVVMAMIQTLRGDRLRRLTRPTLIVVDEAHRAPAPTYVAALAHLGAFGGVRTLGLSATLTRDGGGVGDVFESIADRIEISWAVDNGYLVRPHAKVVVVDHMRLDSARVSRGDYQDGELGEMVQQDTDQIVKAWLDHASGRVTAAFVPTVDSAHALRDEFVSAGVSAEAVVGSTPAEERRGIYGRLADGTTQVVVNVAVLTEGWDRPEVSCVLWARPTRRPSVYIQGVGRGLRLWPGKTDCLVLDVVGASRYQRLVTLADLLPGAVVDRSALEVAPCEVCDTAPCVCGSARSGPAVLAGPGVYEDVDLFAASEIMWSFTVSGLRYVPAPGRYAVLWPVPGGDGAEPLYLAGHVAQRGPTDGVRLSVDGPEPLDDARRRAEVWASAQDPTITSRRAPWRRKKQPPTVAQLGIADRLGIEGAGSMTRAELSARIDLLLATRRLG